LFRHTVSLILRTRQRFRATAFPVIGPNLIRQARQEVLVIGAPEADQELIDRPPEVIGPTFRAALEPQARVARPDVANDFQPLSRLGQIGVIRLTLNMLESVLLIAELGAEAAAEVAGF
jgi:hypothetical protein